MDVNEKQTPRSYNMRILIPTFALGAVLLTGFSSTTLLAQDQSAAQAAPQQSQPRHAPNPQKQAKKMGKKLGLTSDQVSRIEPILADRAQQMQSVRADATLAPQDRTAKMRGIRQDSDSKIEAFLTDNQKQAYEQLKQSHKHHQQQATAPANS
jgi:periplasmic protein CpxP/Spy